MSREARPIQPHNPSAYSPAIWWPGSITGATGLGPRRSKAKNSPNFGSLRNCVLSELSLALYGSMELKPKDTSGRTSWTSLDVTSPKASLRHSKPIANPPPLHPKKMLNHHRTTLHNLYAGGRLREENVFLFAQPG